MSEGRESRRMRTLGYIDFVPSKMSRLRHGCGPAPALKKSRVPLAQSEDGMIS